MKRILLILLFLLIPAWCWGATYYVEKGGSNTSPYDTLAKAANAIATITALDLAPDDVVEICAGTAGGTVTYSERLLLSANDTGSDGHPITFRGRAGDTVTIDGTGNNGSFQIATDNLNYITLQNLTFPAGNAGAIYVSNINTGLTLSNIRITGGANGIVSAANTVGWTFNNVTISGVTGTGVSLAGGGKTHTNLSISGLTIDGGTDGIKLVGAASPTLSTITVTSGNGKGVWLTGTTGTATLTEITAHTQDAGATNYGLSINSSTTTGSTVTNSNFYNNPAQGVFVEASSGFTFTNVKSYSNGGGGFYLASASSDITMNQCESYSNLSDGFSTSGGCHDITYNGCKSYSNGAEADAGSGDGFTGHNTDYNIMIKYCLAYNNKNTGMAYVSDAGNGTHGWAYNNVFYGNGDANHAIRGGIWLNNAQVNATTGKGWTIKNNIVMNSYNAELWLVSSDKTLLDAGTLVLDNNIYYNASNATPISIDGGANKISWNTYHVTDGYEANSLNSNPFFKSATDFSLTAGSPAIDAGTDLCSTLTTATDMAGNPVCAGGAFVGKGSAPEIGVYEYMGGRKGLWRMYLNQNLYMNHN